MGLPCLLVDLHPADDFHAAVLPAAELAVNRSLARMKLTLSQASTWNYNKAHEHKNRLLAGGGRHPRYLEFAGGNSQIQRLSRGDGAQWGGGARDYSQRSPGLGHCGYPDAQDGRL